MSSESSFLFSSTKNDTRKNGPAVKSYGSSLRKESTQKFLRYVTKPGDTMTQIAIKFGCSIQRLRSVNNRWCNDRLIENETIIVPVVTSSDIATSNDEFKNVQDLDTLLIDFDDNNGASLRDNRHADNDSISSTEALVSRTERLTAAQKSNQNMSPTSSDYHRPISNAISIAAALSNTDEPTVTPGAYQPLSDINRPSSSQPGLLIPRSNTCDVSKLSGSGTTVSAKDFLSQFDKNIATIRSNVQSMEEKSRLEGTLNFGPPQSGDFDSGFSGVQIAEFHYRQQGDGC